MNEDLTTVDIDSPIGPLRLEATSVALVSLRPVESAVRARPRGANTVLDLARIELRAYFERRLSRFETPLAPAGSPFQHRVWAALQAIPEGKTATYGELARALEMPLAARAVGAANARNPIAILIPCHRVVGGDGSLTGYAWGLDKKAWLLAHEASRVATKRSATAPLSP